MKFMKMIFITALISLVLFGACSATGNVEEEPQFELELQEPAATTESPAPPGEDEPEGEPATAVASPTAQMPTEATPANLEETRVSSEDLGPATVVPDVTVVLPDEHEVIPQTTPTTSAPENIPQADDNVAFAKADLSEHLDVPEDKIDLVSYESVMWRDGSLGCPDPKASYIQVIQEGYRVQLSVDGDVYNYHGAQGQPPFLCLNKLADTLPTVPGPKD